MDKIVLQITSGMDRVAVWRSKTGYDPATHTVGETSIVKRQPREDAGDLSP